MCCMPCCINPGKTHRANISKGNAGTFEYQCKKQLEHRELPFSYGDSRMQDIVNLLRIGLYKGISYRKIRILAERRVYIKYRKEYLTE